MELESNLTDEDGDLPVHAERGLERLVSRLDELHEGGHDVHVRVRVTVQEKAVRHACTGCDENPKYIPEGGERGEGGSGLSVSVCKHRAVSCRCGGLQKTSRSSSY